MEANPEREDIDRRAAFNLVRRGLSVRLGCPAPEMPGAVRTRRGRLGQSRFGDAKFGGAGEWINGIRKAAIRTRIGEQIEAVAKALCNGKLPVAEQRILRALAAQLAREDTSPEKK